jgi:hypothetical protein
VFARRSTTCRNYLILRSGSSFSPVPTTRAWTTITRALWVAMGRWPAPGGTGQAGSGAHVIRVSSWDGRTPSTPHVVAWPSTCGLVPSEAGLRSPQHGGLCDAAAPIGRQLRQFQDWMELASTVVPAMTSTRIV